MYLYFESIMLWKHIELMLKNDDLLHMALLLQRGFYKEEGRSYTLTELLRIGT
jgi:hypothetical protein